MYDSTSQRTPGVSVPVPRPPEICTPFNDPQVLDTRLAQPPGSDQSREPATDDGDVNLIRQRLPAEVLRCVRILLVRGVAAL